MPESCASAVLEAWRKTCRYIAGGHAQEFVGQKKETVVLRHVRAQIEAGDTSQRFRLVGPDSQETFNTWKIDLVCADPPSRVAVAVEGKYKVLTDGAITDNRPAASFDLFKLEQYVASGKYSDGLFLWLTNQPRYLEPAAGSSTQFSTHHGRICSPGTPLQMTRAREGAPLTLILTGNYVFDWQRVSPDENWYSLEVRVVPAGQHANGADAPDGLVRSCRRGARLICNVEPTDRPLAKTNEATSARLGSERNTDRRICGRLPSVLLR